MEHKVVNGIYGDSDVYQFFTVEEAEQHKDNSSVWKKIVKDFKEFLGKHWLGKHNEEYTIIGLEDNHAFCDYYWILKDKEGRIKYELVNNADFNKFIY